MNLSEKELEALLPKVELVEINVPQLHPDNPRTITEKKFKELVRSVEAFYQMLFLRPLVLNDLDQVLGGNMRLLAAKKAGLKQIPVLRAVNLTELQQREFMIKDNLPFGDWNFDALANEWSQDLLQDWGLSLAAFAPAGPVTYTPSDDIGDAGSRSSAGTDRKPAATSFNVLVKCHTEFDRVQLETILNNAGMYVDEHFYHV